MNATARSDWLTNLAASCVIIFSLTGSAAFIMALFYMSQAQASHKVLLPAHHPISRPVPTIPLLSDPIRSESEFDGHEEFERSRIMASYQAMHSIYN